MWYQNSVLDRTLVSDESGGLEAPDTDLEQIEHHIGRLPDSDLKQAVIGAQRLVNRTHVEMGLLIGEVDRRHLPEIEERLSSAQWLLQHCTMPPAEATAMVKTARALPEMPIVAQQALDGTMPWQSVRILTQARDKHPTEFTTHEKVFAHSATSLSVRDLKRAVAHWEQQVNCDQALVDVRRLDTQRGLYHSQTLDGLWATTATFTPEGGHIIKQAIDGICDPANLDPAELRSPCTAAHRRRGRYLFLLPHPQHPNRYDSRRETPRHHHRGLRNPQGTRGTATRDQWNTWRTRHDTAHHL